MTTNTDIFSVVLKQRGFVIGDRDPLMNTGFSGCFMVAEDYSEYGPRYTQVDATDAAQVYCIVGDDLDKLIDAAYRHLCWIDE